MSVQNRTTLKSYFNTGDTPTEVQFASLVDSFWHKTDDTLAVDWANVGSKPTEFAPSAHTHAWADITGKPTEFAPSAHTHAWADITGKPSTFAPSAHNHSASEITSGTLAAARLAAGTTTDGYMIKLVAGVPTWDVAPAGGGGTPAGSSGQVQYNNGGAFAASANFNWDNANSRLGIGTASPSYALDVNGTARFATVPTIITATKMLVKDPATGQVSEQLIPAGGGLSGLTTNYITKATSSTTIGLSQIQDDGTYIGFGGSPNSVNKAFIQGGSLAIVGGSAYDNPGGASSSMIMFAQAGVAAGFQCYNSTPLTLQPIAGSVGVGTQSPTALMHIAGTLKVSPSGTTRLEVDSAGKFFLRSLPVYADEAAAVSGGLASEAIYKTSTGEIRIKL